MKSSLILVSLLINIALCAQDYTYYPTGDTDNIDTNPMKGFVLAGGGSDNDNAMKWMLQRADGGDVVVLRTSGSNGYNSYFYSELGIEINSVETIVFNNRNASFDTQVQDIIQGAELIFLAGGDQTLYYDYWKDTPIQDILRELINTKEITIAGTSAGMASLGNIAYFPTSSGVISSEALSNPYHPFMDSIRYDDFLQIELFKHVIMDTHFDNRDRSGRLVAMMARSIKDYDIVPFAIACNEVTAVCIDENGQATVFGEYPEYDDFAYFIEPICPQLKPENVSMNQSLTWDNGDYSLKVRKVYGTESGNYAGHIKDWQFSDVNQLEYETWGATNGQLNKQTVEAEPECIVSSFQVEDPLFPILKSNLVSSTLEFSDHVDIGDLENIKLFDMYGTTTYHSIASDQKLIQIDHLNSGLYIIQTKKALARFIKI